MVKCMGGGRGVGRRGEKKKKKKIVAAFSREVSMLPFEFVAKIISMHEFALFEWATYRAHHNYGTKSHISIITSRPELYARSLEEIWRKRETCILNFLAFFIGYRDSERPYEFTSIAGQKESVLVCFEVEGGGVEFLESSAILSLPRSFAMRFLKTTRN